MDGAIPGGTPARDDRRETSPGLSGMISALVMILCEHSINPESAEGLLA